MKFKTIDELNQTLDTLIKNDKSEDNSFAVELTEVKEFIGSLQGVYDRQSEEIESLKKANTNLKATNFDLLSRVGKPTKVDESENKISIKDLFEGENKIEL